MRRRSFTRILAANGLVALGANFGCSTRVPSHPAPPPGPLPNPVSVQPQDSGIEHVVVVTMENRSFDHFLGWLPGADGIPAGLSFPDKSGGAQSPYALGRDYTGCNHPAPDNSYELANETAYNGGKMDGFLRVPGNDIYSIGYYQASDLPFFASLAQNYVTCDHWFASILGETFPNRMFLWTAQTDRLTNTISLSGLPTIFDSLATAGISHRYYFGNIPFLALWGLKYLSSSAGFDDFLEDAQTGRLPAVSFVDPKFTVLDDGLGNDDHPHADVRNGDAFLAQVFHAVSTGPRWSNTVLIITFDEWGGFFDHVAPPRAVAPNNVDTNLLNGEALLGFRVPTIIASPFTKARHKVDSAVYDHTAVLKLIEWRWGLSPLTLRDASPAIGNPIVGFNFKSPDASVPALPMPGTVPALPCAFRGLTRDSTAPTATTEYQALKDSQLFRDWGKSPR